MTHHPLPSLSLSGGRGEETSRAPPGWMALERSAWRRMWELLPRMLMMRLRRICYN